MDPGTGSAALDIRISLMGLATLILTVIDTVQIAFALSCWSVSMTMNDKISYWETGDYKYANSLMRDLILNLATFGAFKILEAVLPGVIKLFKSILG